MKNIFEKLPDGLVKKLMLDNISEITLRAGKKVVVKANNRYYKIDYVMSFEEIEEVFKQFCNLSVYAYLDEIRSGFITVKGGHRIGICGTVVVRDNKVYNIKNISSVNIRIACEIKGCSDFIDFSVKNLLVISPPCCGKTTLIRDLCRKIGAKNKITIIDERGEIAGVYNGISPFDIGDMTDVLSLVEKKSGIEYAIRSMSPEYIVVDEISNEDCEAIKKSFSYGVNIIATAHGNDYEDVLARLGLEKKDKTFNHIIVLSDKKGVGTIEEVIHIA